MKKTYLLCFVLAFWAFISQAAAQQTLREWYASLEEEETSEAGSESAAVNKKRIAFLFSQTHIYDPDTSKLEFDKNIAFRVGNYIQVKGVLERFGGFEAIYTLMGPRLTKENVQQAFQCMAQETSPGDEIFIYWESHGSSGLRDQSGEEADGYNEFLYLGNPEIQHCITDDEFSDLLKKLNGRKVMILMEACHSGGFLSRELRNDFQKSFSYFQLNEEESMEDDLEEYCSEINYASLLSFLPKIMTEGDARNSGSANLTSLNDFLPKKGGKKKKNAFFKSVFKPLGVKDIGQDHADISVIFTAGETEGSYCALVTRDGDVFVYDYEEGRYNVHSKVGDSECLPIGAPVFALVLAMADTSGKYSDEHHTDFADVWNIAKVLIPENCERINAERNTGTTQTPHYLNTIGPIDVCPEK